MVVMAVVVAVDARRRGRRGRGDLLVHRMARLRARGDGGQRTGQGDGAGDSQPPGVGDTAQRGVAARGGRTLLHASQYPGAMSTRGQAGAKPRQSRQCAGSHTIAPVSVAGKTAIVTGAATGIGRATAELLAARGARVVAAGLQPDELRATAEGIAAAGGEALAVDADVSDEQQIRALAARAQEAYGPVQILVNNAAIYPLGPWHEADGAQWDAVFATNVRGYFLHVSGRAAADARRRRRRDRQRRLGHVLLGEPMLASYVASKGAVIGFTRSMAREAGPENIRVNAVAPGAFPTAATRIHPDQEALWSGVLANQSIKRRGEVEDVARAIAFFASDDAGFVTGQTLLVDGGWMRGDDDVLALDAHVVAAQRDLRIGEAAAGRHVVLQAVPRADDHLAVVDPARPASRPAVAPGCRSRPGRAHRPGLVGQMFGEPVQRARRC